MPAQIQWEAERGFTELGDEKLSSLASTIAEILGVDETTELVTNGTFPTNTAGWTGSNATLSVVSGALRVTAVASGLAYAYQAITTEIGQTYKLSADFVTDGKTGTVLVLVGTTSSNFDLFWQAGTSTAPATFSYVFKATSTTSYVRLYLDSSTLAGEYADFDNVSCKKTGNKICNDGFQDSVNTQWTKGTGWTISGGLLSCDGSQTSTSYTTQAISQVTGSYYVVTYTVSGFSAGFCRINLQGVGGTYRSANGTYTETILSANTNGNLEIEADADFVGSIDNISVRLAVPDSSNNTDGLAVYGQITKSAVATGADLVGYSGYSSSNYLQQPANGGVNLNPGTGDFYVLGWFKTSLGSVGIFDWKDPTWTAGQSRIQIQINSANDFAVFLKTSSVLDSSYDYNDGLWHFFTVTRISGVLYIYIDKILVGSTAATDDLTVSGAVVQIGKQIHSGGFTNGHNSCLIRYADGVGRTSTEITTIYNNEKHLFEPYSYYTQVGEVYTLSNLVTEKDREQGPAKSRNISIGGQIESIVDRYEIFYNLTSGLLHYADDLPEWREFLYSTQADQVFTFTPGSGYQPNTDVLCSLESESHSERRINNSIFHRISIKLRDRSDG